MLHDEQIRAAIEYVVDHGNSDRLLGRLVWVQAEVISSQQE